MEELKNTPSLQPILPNASKNTIFSRFKQTWIQVIFFVFIISVFLATVIITLKLKESSNHTQLLRKSTLPSPTIKINNPLSNQFQEILFDKCKKDGTILLEDFPFIVNLNIVRIDKIYCEGFPNAKERFVVVKYGNRNSLYIHDEFSREPGHGGLPYLGLIGKVIKTKDNSKISVYFNGWGEGPSQYIEYLYVAARGFKELTVKNGERILITTTIDLVREGDPRLIALLNKYAKRSDDSSGQLEVEYSEELEKAIEHRFYEDFSKLEDTEKQRISYLEKILDAVDAK